mgnify:CR=1 FL=1
MDNLSNSAIIFLVILGCVVAVLIGYAIHYTMTNGFYRVEDNREISWDQRHYMKSVRDQNRKWLALNVSP